MQDSRRMEKQDSKGFFKSFNKSDLDETTKYAIMFFYAALILVSGFFFNSMGEIIDGLGKIIVARSVLVSDYMAIGNIGATLVNCGLTTLASIIVAKIADVEMDGLTIAAIFTIAGFALFGKNVYNIWPIYLGTYLYALYTKERFKKYSAAAFFGTALGPLVSQISFGAGLPLAQGIILGCIAGIITGFIIPSMAAHFPKFHQGFSLYNIGFTAGMTGFLFMSFMRAFGRGHDTLSIALSGYNFVFTVYLSVMFISMIALGYILNDKDFSGYGTMLKRSGQAPSDFVALDGFGLTLTNMGVIGLMSVAYVLLVKGDLNGPNIGGILTIIAFGAFGKHAKNIIPIFIGVFLASTLFSLIPGTSIPAPGALTPVLAALFGTTLAPIAGEYGWLAGIVAGIIHMVAVVNTAYLHGGMDLYNNGFTGGLVAACLVPIIDGLIKGKRKLAKANN
ncbi:MAG TPA: DUF1576 domain-containing protein [Clostridia bacterium]|nr:DUF1576 domain-containing protein [Clostridia bacterium]